jgi:hypothetical protein
VSPSPPRRTTEGTAEAPPEPGLGCASSGTKVSGKGERMYWFNPRTRNSERTHAPSTDEEAIEMLAGGPDSASFVSEFAKLRASGM